MKTGQLINAALMASGLVLGTAPARALAPASSAPAHPAPPPGWTYVWMPPVFRNIAEQRWETEHIDWEELQAVIPGHWEWTSRQVLVSPGYWQLARADAEELNAVNNLPPTRVSAQTPRYSTNS
jgi:hypothetical protein